MENQTMTLAEKALLMHEKWNGKLETIAKSKVNSREDLAIAYTPGVAEPCKMIAKDPEAAYKYTMKAVSYTHLVVGTDLLGTVTGTDLAAAHLRLRIMALLLLNIVELCL